MCDENSLKQNKLCLLQTRLTTATTAIQSYEQKLSVGQETGSSVDINVMLLGIREAAEMELLKYKQESEAMFAKRVRITLLHFTCINTLILIGNCLLVN